MADADQGELLSLVALLSSMFSTCACISCLRAYGLLYWGRLMGRASPTGISRSMTLVPLKSFVSSSWKTWAYYSSILTLFVPMRSILRQSTNFSVYHTYNLYKVFTRLHVSAPTGPSSGLIHV